MAKGPGWAHRRRHLRFTLDSASHRVDDSSLCINVLQVDLRTVSAVSLWCRSSPSPPLELRSCTSMWLKSTRLLVTPSAIRRCMATSHRTGPSPSQKVQRLCWPRSFINKIINYNEQRSMVCGSHQSFQPCIIIYPLQCLRELLKTGCFF